MSQTTAMKGSGMSGKRMSHKTTPMKDYKVVATNLGGKRMKGKMM